MKAAAIVCSVVLGCGMVMAQEQSSGTVNTLSVDPEQNQRLSGQMGTTTGQPNDVSRGADRNSQLGNPSSRPISGQQSDKASQNQQQSKHKTSGSPAANQKSASTNSGKAPRRTDNRDHSNPQ